MPDPRVNQRRAQAFVVALALPIGVVAGLIALLGGIAAAAVVFVVVSVLVAAAVWLSADRRAVAAIGGADANPVAHARLVNLVEGLCVGAGLAVPRVLVVPDTALNAVAVGRDPRRATLAVTSALVEQLSVIELEGVVAEELVRIKRRDTLPGTIATGTGAIGRRLAQAADGDEDADLGAVALTRYPPGLASALEKMRQLGTGVGGRAGRLGDLWLADPSTPDAGAAVPDRRPPLAERVRALRAL